MVRIAIAGAGGFAQILAQHISQTTEHALIVLSRRVCRHSPLVQSENRPPANQTDSPSPSSKSTAPSAK